MCKYTAVCWTILHMGQAFFCFFKLVCTLHRLCVLKCVSLNTHSHISIWKCHMPLGTNVTEALVYFPWISWNKQINISAAPLLHQLNSSQTVSSKRPLLCTSSSVSLLVYTTHVSREPLWSVLRLILTKIVWVTTGFTEHPYKLHSLSI